MKAPRSDVVFRRFMRGESVEDIVADRVKWLDWPQSVCLRTLEVEAALRRAFAKNRKRRSR